MKVRLRALGQLPAKAICTHTPDIGAFLLYRVLQPFIYKSNEKHEKESTPGSDPDMSI